MLWKEALDVVVATVAEPPCDTINDVVNKMTKLLLLYMMRCTDRSISFCLKVSIEIEN